MDSGATSEDTTTDPNLVVSPTPSPLHDPYAALCFQDFRLLTASRLIFTLGEQMVNVAIDWELYLRTHSALALGFVGLAQVLPIIVLSLPAGYVADRFDRKQVVIVSYGLLGVGVVGLAVLSATRGAVPLVYLCLLLLGVGNTFLSAASSTLIVQTVPHAVFENAATWSSSAYQLASVIGPALGGIVIAWRGGSATLVYVLDVVAIVLSIAMLLLLRGRPTTYAHETPSLRSMAAGIRFIWQTQIIMAAITLDLFAVLLGGATALLPIYATDILHVGAAGLGWLRAAPSVGAVSMALFLAHKPPFRRAGRVLLIAVAGFGVATIVFGASHIFWLSVAMLAVLGALDNISVVIRSTLLLLRTPDAMRGRISAVNNIFVGASNELGGFESGVAAALVGPIIAVVAGGIGTLAVVLLVACIWPEMRKLGRLNPASDSQKEAD